MKLTFNIVLFAVLAFSQAARAREIIVIEHIQNNETASMVKNILIKKFQLPASLIKIYGLTNNCSEKSDAIVQLCVLKNGELEIKKINRYVLKSAFNIFLDQKE